MEREGFEVTYLPVEQNGIISMDKLREAIRPETLLVSAMTVNNEIGVRQPVEEIGELCRENKIFFHTDAAQAVGKIPLSVNDMKIDLMSISGHKIYGPKGIGGLPILSPILTPSELELLSLSVPASLEETVLSVSLKV